MDDDQKEFVMSYETIFDLLKRERERLDLQNVDDSFFHELVNFINDKKKDLEESTDEKKKALERQLENIKKLLNDFYNKREKKIIGLALDKSKTKSIIVDDAAFLKEEKIFFNDLIGLFDRYRNRILFNVVEGKMPSANQIINSNPENSAKNQQEPTTEFKKDTKLVRFIHAVPKFLGEELEQYGPYEEEDIANLPTQIADLLITKGRVEEINSD